MRFSDPELARQYDREQYERHKVKRKANRRARFQNERHKERATKAIERRITRGKMLPAICYPCSRCGKQARDYHHPSYLPEDRLNVVPLCRSCHVKVHHQQETPLFGSIVALKVGMVRIAIADNE